MREFYERSLGFRLLSADAREARFETGAHEIVLRADPPFGDAEYRDFVNQLKGNMRGMGASFHFEVPDIEAWFHALSTRGLIPIDPEKNRRLERPIPAGEGRREFAIEDPEGYWIYFEGA